MQRFKSLMNRPIGYGTVAAMLIGTLLMTVLFWKAQNPILEDRNQLILELTEFKYYGSRLELHLIQAQRFGSVDTLAFMTNLNIVRDMGRRIGNRFMDIRASGEEIPDTLLTSLDQAVMIHLNRMEFLLMLREQTRRKLDSLFVKSCQQMEVSRDRHERQQWHQIVKGIRNLRMGNSVEAWDGDSSFVAWSQLQQLQQDCLNQQKALQELRLPRISVLVEDLIFSLNQKNKETLREKAYIHQGFYLLSLLFLLIVLVQVVRVPR